MNPNNIKLASDIISKSYIQLGQNSVNSYENIIKVLLSQRQIPENGLNDFTIEYILQNIALLDTNNFPNKVGVGERESRIYSSIVAKRHFYMGHGIGRSGDVAAEQPKAAGSSLILKLTKYLLKHALKIMGLQFVEDLLIVPLATGMMISLALLYLISISKPKKYILWSRIDQKTCLKCIKTVNLVPIVIEGTVVGDEIQTNLGEFKKKIQELGAENILCIISTTSCFAPRVPDNIEELGKICKENNIFHVINNAYGLQCSKIVHQINQATKNGRVDLVVQSTDKNFLVPVGGAFVFSHDKQLIKGIAELYPGRASASPILDLFITLLAMGKKGLEALLQERKANLQYMQEKIKLLANAYQERMLITPNNTISIGMTLKNYFQFCTSDDQSSELTLLGSILYSKRVMGTRITVPKPSKEVCGIKFKNYGSNLEINYPHLPYMTMACAIGVKKEEIDEFIEKLNDALHQFDCKFKQQIKQKQIQQEENKMQNLQCPSQHFEINQKQTDQDPIVNSNKQEIQMQIKTIEKKQQ